MIRIEDVKRLESLVNKSFERKGSRWRVKVSNRYNYTALDKYLHENNPYRNEYGEALKIGTKKEIYNHLDAMLDSLNLSEDR